MELLEAIYSRRAVREFTAEPVDETLVRTLIDVAVRAPSAMNQQPWSFCVIRNQALQSTGSAMAELMPVSGVCKVNVAAKSLAEVGKYITQCRSIAGFVGCRL